MTIDVRPLSTLRVVDLSTWIAGAYAGRLLADGGAAVTRAEPDGGHPLRRWSASRSRPEGEDGALFRHLTAGTELAPVDHEGDLHELLAGADACLWSPGGRLDPETIAAAHPQLVVVAVTPFGRAGSWRDHPATEFTIQAWSGGIIGLGRGDPERPPVHVAGQVGEWLAGGYAAVGLLAARRAGTAGVVDVSMLEVAALGLTYHPVTFHDLVGRPMRTRRALTVPGVARASDGLVGLGVGTGQQWLDFCAMTGHPEWTEDASLFSERGALVAEIDAWVGPQPMAEVLDLASAFRIPNAPIVDGANAPTIDHLHERDVFAPVPGSADGALAPRSPLRFTAAPDTARTTPPPATSASVRAGPGEPSGEAPGDASGGARPPSGALGTLPFDGLRVLDMTAFWAGPSATHLFALLGAEVVHLESGRRPDGARAVGVSPKEADRPWERAPIFTALNTNKKSLTLDFATPEGLDLLRRFVATCDVVVENYTPRVLDQLGLDDAGLRALNPAVIVVRMPGFGLTGPSRLHAAFGLLLALAHRDATGAGCQVEAAMVDAALSIAAEQVIEHSTYGVRLERAGNRGPVAAPQDLYDCADPVDAGREPARVAIAVATDAQWASLRRALGEPPWAAAPTLDAFVGRDAARDEIDEHLRAWCGARTVAEVVDALREAGVPVAEVRQPHDQPDLPPMRERGFFEDVDHPVSGPARCSTLPFRLPGRDRPLHTRHAPLLGEHTAELLGELGLDDDDLAALAVAGVIATAPEGAA